MTPDDDAIDLRTCSLLGWTGMQWAYIHWARREQGRPIRWMPSETVDTISWAAEHQSEWRAGGAEEPLDLAATMAEQDLLWAEQMFDVIARQLQASGQLWPNKPREEQPGTRVDGAFGRGTLSPDGNVLTLDFPQSEPSSLEERIAARPAPKVTPADIEAEIVGEYYFTAAEGAIGQQLCDKENLTGHVGGLEHADALKVLTFCVIVLRNGFTVTGESACASPENFDAQIGREVARKAAVAKLWPLLGFRLRDRLHAQAQFDAEPKTGEQVVLTDADAAADLAGTPRPDNPSTGVLSNLPAHQQRMRDERDELSQRIYRLKAFFGSETFNALEEDERFLMEDQLEHMENYLKTLQERIAIFFNAQQNP